jgi:hypothetical protein
MYSGAEISLGIGGLGIASYSFRFADHRRIGSCHHQEVFQYELVRHQIVR